MVNRVGRGERCMPIVDPRVSFNYELLGDLQPVEACRVNQALQLFRKGPDCILDTLPVARRKEEAARREYRTKRHTIERHDAMASTDAAGDKYQTWLDPSAADPSLRHPESTHPDWLKRPAATSSAAGCDPDRQELP